MYVRSILDVGGLPVVLPGATDRDVLAELVRRSDGVLLTGGDDVNPELYLEKIPARLAKTVGHTDRPRDFRELVLINEIFRQRKPLLAICRGHQLLNVALGGTLIVDIKSQVRRGLEHVRLDKKSDIVHEAQLTRGSLLAKISGTHRLGVNSSHHQAVDKVARTLRVAGRSSDGVIEAMELKLEAAGWLPFMVSVQYHPERLAAKHAEHRELFGSFVRACARGRRKIS
jgi:putative glutamine amidotransferase